MTEALQQSRKNLVESLYQHREARQEYNSKAKDADDALCILISELQTFIESIQWQPIETAPKNGTVIDLWCPESGRWADCVWFKSTNEWATWPDQHSLDQAPTHWMPTPSPPTESSS